MVMGMTYEDREKAEDRDGNGYWDREKAKDRDGNGYWDREKAEMRTSGKKQKTGMGNGNLRPLTALD